MSNNKEELKENLDELNMKKLEETRKKVKEKATNNKDTEENEKLKQEKVNNILKKAKEKGKITYGDLASELDDANPEQIDKVFDAFEELGVNLLSDDMEEEPNLEDLKEVEELKLDEITDTWFCWFIQSLIP